MVDQAALYAVLGLSPGSDRAAVRDAYRQLARRFHPDVNRSADAAERMRVLNAAYNTLRDLPVLSAAAPHSQPTTAGPASAPFAGFGYRVSANAGAVAVGSPLFVPINGVTIGIVAAFVGLVTLLAVWAFAVAKPFGSGTAAVSQPRVTTPATVPSLQSTTSTLAAQASANAAANAAAARSNLTSGGAAAAKGVAPAASRSAPSNSAVHEVESSEVPSAPPTLDRVTQPLDAQVAAQSPEAPVDAARRTSAPIQPESRPVQPSVPAVPATQPSAAPHISAVSGQPPATSASITAPASAPVSADAAVAQTAIRALSAYDRAWTNYANALRFAAADSLMTHAASAASAGTTAGISAPTGAARLASMSPSSLLSGGAQLTMARTAHFQQQLVWNTQSSAALTAAAAASLTIPLPDPAKAVRAEQRLRQAADLVSQSSAVSPLNTTQLKSLLDEAEQLHRESVAEWAKLLASLG